MKLRNSKPTQYMPLFVSLAVLLAALLFNPPTHPQATGYHVGIEGCHQSTNSLRAVNVPALSNEDVTTVYLGNGVYRSTIYLQTSRTRDTYNAQPDYTAGMDTFISQNFPTYNFGAATYDTDDSGTGGYYAVVFVGNDQYTGQGSPAYGVSRALLRLDLSALPQGITDVTFANVSMYMGGYYDTPTGVLQISVHKVTHTWVEGSGLGNSASSGQGVSWNTYDGTNPWSSVGGDFDPTPLSTTGVGTAFGFYSWEITSLAKDWLVNGEANYGMLFKSTTEGTNTYRQFITSDVVDSNAYLRPKIMIQYTLNERPIATIASIEPNPAYYGDTITLDATGSYDPDGTVVAYEWNSSLDGTLGTMQTLTLDAESLSVGTHNITLRVQDSEGLWSYPVSTTLEVVYNARPANLTVISFDDTPGDDGGSLTLKWVSANEADFKQYNIYVSKNFITDISGMDPEITINDMSTDSTEITTCNGASMQKNVDYYCAITVVDEHNLMSGFQCYGPAQALNDRPPESVSGLNAYDTPNDNGGAITIEWSPVEAQDFQRYDIYIDKEQFFNISGMSPVKSITSRLVQVTTLTTADYDLEDGEGYWVAIVAVDTAGNYLEDVAPYGPVSPLNDLRPEKLSSVSAYDRAMDEGGALSVSWSKTYEEDFQAYLIFASGSEGNLSSNTISRDDAVMVINNIDTTSADITESMDGPLVNGLEYYIAVAVLDTGNNIGDYDIKGPYVPLDNLPPPKVTNVRAYDTPNDNGGSITVEWDALSDVSDFQCYKIYLSTSSSMDIQSLTPAVTITNIKTTSVVVNSMGGEALEDGKRYYVAVVAFDDSGNFDTGYDTSAYAVPADNIPPEITEYSPEHPLVYINASVSFSVSVAQEDKGKVSYTWYVDDTHLNGQDGASIDLSPSDFQTPGNHVLKVVVEQEGMQVYAAWNLSVKGEDVDDHHDKDDKNETPVNRGSDMEQYYMYIGLGVVVLVLIAMMAVVLRRRSAVERAASDSKGAEGKKAPDKTSYPTYYGTQATDVYKGPYTSTQPPLYYMDQSYTAPTYLGGGHGGGWLDSLRSGTKPAIGEGKPLPSKDKKKTKPALPDTEKKPTLPTPGPEKKELAKVPVKKVPAYMAHSLEEAERLENLKKEEKKRARKREKGEICSNQNAPIDVYVCPPSDMKKCKLTCLQKDVFIASKASNLNRGKKVKRCVFRNASVSVFLCPKNVRERCELNCTQKDIPEKTLKGKDYHICPMCWTHNPVQVEKCKKCGTSLWSEGKDGDKGDKDSVDSKGKDKKKEENDEKKRD